jgi:putative colanic acid biosynthesis acetyltransferase WcaF
MIIQGNSPFTAASFSLRNRCARALWAVVWTLLFRPSPWFAYRWRNTLLRMFGAQVGRGVRFSASVRVWAPWQLTVGDRVLFGSHAHLYNMAPLDVQDGAIVSQGAHLCGGSHDIDSPNFQLIAKPITIRRHAWVCAEAFVGPGVVVDEGCVVAARAVVMRSIDQPWTVWAGNPAVVGRQRKRSIAG